MLRLIGYWHSEGEPHWPDPARFIDPHWSSAERARLASYLRSATVLRVAGGGSWCRFRCAQRWTGSAERSDGVFVWPEGLVHYVESHQLRPPDEFVRHVLERRVPQQNEVSSDFGIDSSWWAAQRGHGQGASFRSPSPRGAFVANLEGIRSTVAAVAALRAFPGARELSVSELTNRIARGARLVLLPSEYEMPRPAALASLEAFGIPIHFEADAKLPTKPESPMYCPYCGAATWFDRVGEAHCPGGGLFSRALSYQLRMEFPAPITLAESKPTELVSRWHCPGCGWRIVRGTRLDCVNCARDLSPLIYNIVEFNPHPPIDRVGAAPEGGLIPYWITTHRPGSPLGFGVTAYSLEDARELLTSRGFELPEGSEAIAHVKQRDLDPLLVTPNAGPIDTRGLWFPLIEPGG